MGSVQFQIVPYSNLYFFSRSIGPFQCLVNGNDRVLICCICHFQSSSLILFILASSVCQSLQCLICALTQGGEGGHLFRLTCSVVLWEGRNTANKYHWRVWGVFAVYGPLWGCPSSQRVCFPGLYCWGSGLLCRGTPKWALGFVHFLGYGNLSCSGSGSRVLHKGTDLFGHVFCADHLLFTPDSFQGKGMFGL